MKHFCEWGGCIRGCTLLLELSSPFHLFDAKEKHTSLKKLQKAFQFAMILSRFSRDLPQFSAILPTICNVNMCAQLAAAFALQLNLHRNQNIWTSEWANAVECKCIKKSWLFIFFKKSGKYRKFCMTIFYMRNCIGAVLQSPRISISIDKLFCREIVSEQVNFCFSLFSLGWHDCTTFIHSFIHSTVEYIWFYWLQLL